MSSRNGDAGELVEPGGAVSGSQLWIRVEEQWTGVSVELAGDTREKEMQKGMLRCQSEACRVEWP